MWLLTRENQTRLPRRTSLTLPPHLLVGSRISLLILIISGNRETTPIYLSGYIWFIANQFAFLFPFTKIYWLHLRSLPFAARVLIFFGEKQLQKALGDRGTGACAKETNKLFLGVEGGRGEDRRILPPVPWVLSFFCLLRFCKFQTTCFPSPL